MTTIATDLRNTIESARRIRFEPTSTNSATNVQDAIVGASAGLLPFLTTPTVVAGSGNIAATDVVVQTNQSGAITLVVPASAVWAAQNSKYGLPLSIFDISGNASANNVTINFTGGETVSGLSSLSINTNFGGYRIEPKSGGGWIVV